MAEEQLNDAPAPEGGGEPKEQKPVAKKKKKKSSLKKYFFLLLIVIGVTVGLQLSGTMDFRPQVYTIVPRLPVIGESLAELIRVPAIYSLSAEERRDIELNERETYLAETKRSLDEQDAALRALSADLDTRSGDLNEALAELQRKIAELNESGQKKKRSGSSGGGDVDPEEAEGLIRTFGEMSPKNAAAIIEKLQPDLAVVVLDGLDNSFRARTLGKMQANVAAALMERLTEYQAEKDQ